MSSEVHCVGLELLNLDLGSLELTNALNINPLHCLLCQQLLSEPCSLPCHHVFCKHCLTDRQSSGVIYCPLCGVPSPPTASGTLVTDRLLKFFVQSASEKADTCANCDETSQPMWFCETCQQPLCAHCKDETHQAKMFAAHKLVPLQERTGFGFSRKCELHDEPFILFSQESKNLVCIKCFRSASIDVRPHCVDLDVAYDSGCQKLEHVFKCFKGFQKDLENNILLHKTLLEEVQRGAQSETSAVQQLCQQMVDKLLEIRDALLQQISKDCAEREEHFKSNLKHLIALVPTAQLYLLIASIFGSSASKMDFLELGYTLMARMNAIVAENQERRPRFSSQIQANAKAEFARVLEPYFGCKSVLMPLQSQLSGSQERTILSSACAAVLDQSRTLSGDISPASSINSAQYARLKRCPNMRPSKFAQKADLAGAFGEQFAAIDQAMKDLVSRFSAIRKEAQELQRDLTLRRCLVDETRLKKLLHEGETFKTELASHASIVDAAGSHFSELWEEQISRVRTQQMLYQVLVQQTTKLQDDVCRVTSVADKLDPFIRSIKAAILAIAPGRSLQEHPWEAIRVMINTLEPDSQSRVDAAEREESHRRSVLEEQKQKEKDDVATLKTRLKTPRNAPRRCSGADKVVLREVVRERDLAGSQAAILQAMSALSFCAPSTSANPPAASDHAPPPPAHRHTACLPIDVNLLATVGPSAKAFSASPAAMSPRSPALSSFHTAATSQSGRSSSSLDQSLNESLDEAAMFAVMQQVAGAHGASAKRASAKLASPGGSSVCSVDSCHSQSQKTSSVSEEPLLLAAGANCLDNNSKPAVPEKQHKKQDRMQSCSEILLCPSPNEAKANRYSAPNGSLANEDIASMFSTSLPEKGSPLSCLSSALSGPAIEHGGNNIDAVSALSSSTGNIRASAPASTGVSQLPPPPPFVPPFPEMIEMLKKSSVLNKNSISSSSAAASLNANGSGLPATAPKKSKGPKIPVGVKVEPSAIQARERLFASLKKKVPVCNVGPPSKNNSPDRDFGPSKPPRK